MKLQKTNLIGFIIATIMLILDFVIFFSEKNLFYFLAGISIAIAILPFVINISLENKKEQEIGEMFLEFSRNLAESVSTGTPVSKSIMNVKSKNYGSLSPHIEKLANQIALGIPLDQAFQNFANDVDSRVISRAVALIREAEKAGGEIDYILESVAKSISEIERLKKERKAAIYNLVVQGYIVFFIFIGIMLVMEYKILPLTSGLQSLGTFGGDGVNLNVVSSTAGNLTPEALSQQFLYLLLAQGFFAGLAIGKLTEGTIKSGIKHSFILTITAFLISSGARVLIGGATGAPA